jgi:aspartate/methionine/tyrosine aminotransferase
VSASSGISQFLHTVITGLGDAITLLVPRNPLYSALVSLFRAQLTPYDLIEEGCWSFDTDSIGATVRPKAFVAVSPGNPTGTVLARLIIDLCEAEGFS